MNYQLKMEEILNSFKGKKKLLLHACCAPCSSYVLETLSKYFDITILYYNPNITSKEEYEKRYNELKTFLSKIKLENNINILNIEYNNQEFFDAVKGFEKEQEGGKRCFICYKLRMEKTALLACEQNYDYFTTTLSISPYKNADYINEIGKQLEEKIGIKYLYADFKKKNGYKKSIELSRKYNLYRQDYCGCIFSKISRKKIDN